MSATLKRNTEIWTGPEKHIAFAINGDGVMSGGFTDQVLERWPELDKIGPKPMGWVFDKIVGESNWTNGHSSSWTKQLHAMVCRMSTDLSRTPSFITACLDLLDVPDDEPIAVLLPGAGAIGRSQGADVDAIYDAIAKSKKTCVVYTYSRELTRA